MRPSPLAVACLVLVLLGIAAGLYRFYFPPGPVADEASYVLATESLWHDHDLAYHEPDLARGYQIWDQGPYGMVLFTIDGGKSMYFGKPLPYSLAAIPFDVVFGVQGFLVLNMLLFVVMVGAGWWLWRRESGAVMLLVAGFFFASVALSYVFLAQPEVFNMTCVFLPLVVWLAWRRRESWGRRELAVIVASGVLLGLAFVSKEPLAVFALPIAADLLLLRRLRAVAALLAGSLITTALLLGMQYKLTGVWSPYRDVQRRSFENEYPLEAKVDLWELYRGTSFGSWSGLPFETNPRVLLRNVVYFFVGRHTGLLPYFPFGLFCLGLYLVGPRSRPQHLLLIAIVAYCVFFLLLRSHNYHGGAGFIGNRYFASVYPALLLLPGRLRAGRSLLLPFAAAALWTAPVVAVPVQRIAPEFGLQVHTRMPAFQALPLELTLVPDRKIPSYWIERWGEGVWIVPRQNFFAQERHPNGVWVRGASRSEVHVVSPSALDAVRFVVYSPLPENVLTLESGAGRVVVDFSSEENRAGALVELPLEEVARDLDGFFPTLPHEHYYRFTLSTTHGWVPARRDAGSTDPRFLSVFLDFTGDGP